ncbi:MAG: universal stress protein [Steroidobacteraceae bacterium]|jgi:universal stress protein E|nr:universal stress protein [Steroidobacteraceae bacterium]
MKLILVVTDPTADDQPAIAKAALLAQRTGACLRLFCCDRDPRLVARLLLDPGALSAARAAFMASRRDWLGGLAEPWAAAGVTVEVESVWDGPVHEAVLREVGLCKPDLVVKDTHWHGPLRRGLFTSTDWYLIQDCPAPLLLVKPAPWNERPRIVAAVDPGHPDDPGDLLDHAILEAGERLVGVLDGELEVVHAFLPVDPALAAAAPGMPVAGLPGRVDGPEDLHRRAQARLAALLSGHPGLASAARLVEGSAVDALPEFCSEHRADLLVAGAMSRSRLYQRVIGSTAERLLDRIPSDLLVIRPPPAG